MLMNSTMVTVTGTAVTGVRYAVTVTGVPVAHFRLAAHERRFDRQRQAWVEGEPSYYTVWAWKWLAENLLGSVLRGDPVLVAGRMRVREWEAGEGKRRGVAAEIEATSIGHDLSRGTTVFRRTVRGQTPRRPLDRARVDPDGLERKGGEEVSAREQAKSGGRPGEDRTSGEGREGGGEGSTERREALARQAVAEAIARAAPGVKVRPLPRPGVRRPVPAG